MMSSNSNSNLNTTFLLLLILILVCGVFYLLIGPEVKKFVVMSAIANYCVYLKNTTFYYLKFNTEVISINEKLINSSKINIIKLNCSNIFPSNQFDHLGIPVHEAHSIWKIPENYSNYYCRQLVRIISNENKTIFLLELKNESLKVIKSNLYGPGTYYIIHQYICCYKKPIGIYISSIRDDKAKANILNLTEDCVKFEEFPHEAQRIEVVRTYEDYHIKEFRKLNSKFEELNNEIKNITLRLSKNEEELYWQKIGIIVSITISFLSIVMSVLINYEKIRNNGKQIIKEIQRKIRDIIKNILGT